MTIGCATCKPNQRQPWPSSAVAAAADGRRKRTASSAVWATGADGCGEGCGEGSRPHRPIRARQIDLELGLAAAQRTGRLERGRSFLSGSSFDANRSFRVTADICRVHSSVGWAPIAVQQRSRWLARAALRYKADAQRKGGKAAWPVRGGVGRSHTQKVVSKGPLQHGSGRTEQAAVSEKKLGRLTHLRLPAALLRRHRHECFQRAEPVQRRLVQL